MAPWPEIPQAKDEILQAKWEWPEGCKIKCKLGAELYCLNNGWELNCIAVITLFEETTEGMWYQYQLVKR